MECRHFTISLFYALTCVFNSFTAIAIAIAIWLAVNELNMLYLLALSIIVPQIF